MQPLDSDSIAAMAGLSRRVLTPTTISAVRIVVVVIVIVVVVLTVIIIGCFVPFRFGGGLLRLIALTIDVDVQPQRRCVLDGDGVMTLRYDLHPPPGEVEMTVTGSRSVPSRGHVDVHWCEINVAPGSEVRLFVQEVFERGTADPGTNLPEPSPLLAVANVILAAWRVRPRGTVTDLEVDARLRKVAALLVAGLAICDRAAATRAALAAVAGDKRE